MERLTIKEENMFVCYRRESWNKSSGVSRNFIKAQEIQDVLDRLADYEDTGLEADEIQKMQTEWRALKEAEAAHFQKIAGIVFGKEQSKIV